MSKRRRKVHGQRRKKRGQLTQGSVLACWLALSIGTASSAAADPTLAHLREQFLAESRAAQLRLSAQQAHDPSFRLHPEGFAQVSELLLDSGAVVMVNGERHGSAKSLGE